MTNKHIASFMKFIEIIPCSKIIPTEWSEWFFTALSDSSAGLKWKWGCENIHSLVSAKDFAHVAREIVAFDNKTYNISAESVASLFLTLNYLIENETLIDLEQ